jgi:hypothetical protein
VFIHCLLSRLAPMLRGCERSPAIGWSVSRRDPTQQGNVLQLRSGLIGKDECGYPRNYAEQIEDGAEG